MTGFYEYDDDDDESNGIAYMTVLTVSCYLKVYIATMVQTKRIQHKRDK